MFEDIPPSKMPLACLRTMDLNYLVFNVISKRNLTTNFSL